MATNFVTKGVQTIQQAVQADNSGEFGQALGLYKQGIQLLLTAKKWEKNPAAEKAIGQKIQTYLARAEEIDKQLSEPEPKKKKKAKAGGRGSADSDDEDEEGDALKKSLGSAIVMERPNVKWSDVAGLVTAKGLLKEAVILPVAFPQLFQGKREPWKGILLYGPPGTGKSYLAKAVATEANNSTFFSVSSSDLVSKYVGESEKLVKNLFVMAREKSPSIIFIDEIDSLASARSDGESDSTRRLKTEFLVQMQGVGNDTTGVLTLGATNCPWDLDPAIRRRFQKRIYIPLPDPEALEAMFKIHIGKTKNSLTNKDFKKLATKSNGFSGSDISNVVKDALMEPVRTMQTTTHFKKIPHPTDQGQQGWLPCKYNDAGAVEMRLMEIPVEERSMVVVPDVCFADFWRVIQNSKPSVGSEDIKRHVEWTNEYGQEG